MADIRFVKIRSWHAVRYEVGTVPWTYCGRTSNGPQSDTLPAGRSCETCLRIVARAADRG